MLNKATFNKLAIFDSIRLVVSSSRATRESTKQSIGYASCALHFNFESICLLSAETLASGFCIFFKYGNHAACMRDFLTFLRRLFHFNSDIHTILQC